MEQQLYTKQDLKNAFNAYDYVERWDSLPDIEELKKQFHITRK